MPSPESRKGRKVRPPRKPTAESLRGAALAHLERFPCGTARLRQVLERKVARYCRLSETGETPQSWAGIIDSLIADLRKAGYLDDDSYARGLARSLTLRGLSARMVAAKMARRGLAPEIIDAALTRQKEEQGGATDDFPAALRLARRRRFGPFLVPGKAPLPPEKALAALARAGFDYETAQRVMRTDRREAEAILLEHAHP